MGLYLCRWENGDFSVIQANNKDDALEMLDEVANAEGLPLYSIKDFMVHFRLTDEGMIELEDFGEEFGELFKKLFVDDKLIQISIDSNLQESLLCNYIRTRIAEACRCA
jgi:hypothetical protein